MSVSNQCVDETGRGQRPYLVTRLDLETWAMHVFPLLTVESVIRLQVTGDGVLLERLARTRVNPIVPVVGNIRRMLPIGFQSIKCVPMGMRAISLNICNMPSAQTQALIKSTLANRPAIVKMRVWVNRYSLPRILPIIGSAPNLNELHLLIVHWLYGASGSNFASLDGAATALENVQHLTIECDNKEALSEQDVKCLQAMKSLRSLHVERKCCVPVCKQTSGFQWLQSLRLYCLKLKSPCKFVVNDLPQTLTALRLKFVFFQSSCWVHGALPPNLTRLSVKARPYCDMVWCAESNATTLCSGSITRLALSVSLSTLFAFGADPIGSSSPSSSSPLATNEAATERRAFNLSHFTRLERASLYEPMSMCEMQLPYSCRKLKLARIAALPPLFKCGDIKALRLTFLNMPIGLQRSLFHSFGRCSPETLSIHIDYCHFDEDSVERICTSLEDVTSDVHITCGAFKWRHRQQVFARLAAFLSARNWFTLRVAGADRIAYYRGRLIC